MTQQEFYDRTRTRLSDGDFAAMHEDYCASQLDKDEYCAQWLCDQLINANKKAAKLLRQVHEINADIKDGGYTCEQVKGLRNIRKSVVSQLYRATETVREWRDKCCEKL